MMRWAPLLTLLTGLLLLGPVTAWFGRRVQGLVFLITGHAVAAAYVYYLLLFPGTLLHELSHLLSARLLGMRTGRLSMRPTVRSDGTIQLGAVQVERSDALRESIVGFSPLIVGTLVMLFLARWRFDIANIADIPRLFAHISAILAVPDVWIWLYLIMSVGNAMLPSASDRRVWLPFAFCSLLLMGALYALGSFLAPAGGVERWGFAVVENLAFATLGTVVLDLLIGGMLWIAEMVSGLLLNRQVRYG
ncbi:MAG: hypothetical protein ACOX9A_05790 [Anaerolineae bacterium]